VFEYWNEQCVAGLTEEQYNDISSSRAEFLMQHGYPLPKETQSEITARNQRHAIQSQQTNDALMHHPDKLKLDAVLSGWVSGRYNDKQMLERLFPLAVHYHYGVADEQLREEVLSDAQKASFPIAQLTCRLWLTMIDHVGGRVGHDMFDAFDSVTHELVFDISREDFRERLRRGRDEPLPPQR
jgi:hypothetical protein